MVGELLHGHVCARVQPVMVAEDGLRIGATDFVGSGVAAWRDGHRPV